MILIFGPQGSGKGTQAELLAQRHGWRALSTGQMLRDSDDPEIQRRLEAGQLIDDALTTKLLADELARIPSATKVILDGYPRNLEQARWLLAHAPDYQRTVICALEIHVPTEESVTRLLARGRNDDTQAAIEQRLSIYHAQTEPILDFYRSQGIPFKQIDGIGSVEEIHQRIEQALAQCGLK